MPLTLESPYSNEESVSWMRGNLHAHSTESDGSRPPQEVIDDYAARGYDFMMLSDHDKLTDPSVLKGRGMVLIPGNEVSAQGPHLLHINAETQIPPNPDRQQVLEAIADAAGLAVLNHPNWQKHFNHCPQERLEALQGYVGIEIYNGVIRRLEGSPLATDRWDRLLSSGRKIWGFANDDSHRPEDVELAWNVVQCSNRTVAAVVDALKYGRFYASTGVTLERIAVHGRTIHIAAPNASRIVVSVDHGKRIAHADSTDLTFHVPDDAPYTYVRLECYGAGEAMAWTQPIYVKK
ncbi:MAG: CehA/McbA family metallohydrolase [Planctomycetota bacterium]|nr:CehA/McbA family metallohydrolase [Planctomycetota bacterium]